LKKILGKLGLSNIRFAPQPKEKSTVKNNNNDLGNNVINKNEKKNSFKSLSSPSVNNKKNLINKTSLLQE